MNEIYTLDEVAKILRIHKETARLLLRSGELRGFQIRKLGNWRVTATALDEYMTRSEEQSLPPEAE